MKRWNVLLLTALLLVLSVLPSQATYYQQLTLKASSATTSTAGSTSVDLVTAVYSTDNRHEGIYMAVYLQTTAVAGTNPTLDVKIQCSPDDTNWFDPTSTSSAQDSYAFAQK